jgi:hypothetical protein
MTKRRLGDLNSRGSASHAVRYKSPGARARGWFTQRREGKARKGAKESKEEFSAPSRDVHFASLLEISPIQKMRMEKLFIVDGRFLKI